MKLLHIIPDDKFWDVPIILFKDMGYQNEFISVVDNYAQNINYIDPTRVSVVIRDDAKSIWQREDIDIYVFHSLSYSYYDYVLSIPYQKKVIWVSWGFDIYYSQGPCPPICQLAIYKKNTEKNRRETAKLPTYIELKRKLRSIFRRLQVNFEEGKGPKEVDEAIAKQNKVIERIDYCSTVLPNEYDLLKEHPFFHAKYFPFQYTRRSRNDFYQTVDDDSNYILVGNSADWSNNHFDIVDALKHNGINYPLYFPVAYGDEGCRNRLKSYMKSYKGQYVFQDRMISYEEYKKVLLKCGVAIFGHIRQQAMGNIYICLMSGCKVFLFKDSVAYKYLKSAGFAIFSIEDDLTSDFLLSRLSTETVEMNRNKLIDFESIETVRDRVGLFLQLIN